MKLHLPKRLFTALLAIITLAAAPAVLTLGSSAWGTEENGDETITPAVDYSVYNAVPSGIKIYQWTGASSRNGSICYGLWYEMSYNGAEWVAGNSVGANAESNGYGNYVNNGQYLLFDANSTDGNSVGGAVGEARFDTSAVSFAGLIVKSDSSVTSLSGELSTANNGSGTVAAQRAITLGRGDSSVQAPTYSVIEKNFTLTNADSTYNTSTFVLQGHQQWEVAESATFSLETRSGQSISQSGSLTIKGKGTVSFLSNLTSSGSVTVDSGACLNLNGGYTQNAGASLTVNGSLTLGGSVVLRDSITANGAVTLNSGVEFNLTNLTKGEDNLYTLFTGAGSVSYTDVSFVGGWDRWSYTMQENGTVLATFLGNTVTLAGDSDESTVFQWTTGTEFSGGEVFEANDNVNITGAEKIKLTSAVTANKVTVGAAGGADMTISFTSDSNALTVVEGFFIQDGATVEIDKKSDAQGFIRGEVTIEDGGVLKFNAQDITGYNGGAASMHTINVLAGGELQMSTTSNESFAGTLNLDGSLKGVHSSGNSARWDMHGGSATINVGAGATASTENIKLYLRQANTDITVGDKATFVHGGAIEQYANYTLAKKGTGSMVVGGNVNIATLNLAAGTMKLQGGATITNVSVAKDSTLTLGKDGATDSSSYSITNLTGAESGSVLKLESNATLNKITTVNNSVTVTGSGTYVMGSTVTTGLTGWTEEDTWSGTVELNGMNVIGDANTALNLFGNENSTIKLSGVYGWLNGNTNNDGFEYASDFVLENGTAEYALKIANGSTDNKYHFLGDISGSGDMLLDFSGPNNLKYTFSGDVSGWTASEQDEPKIERKTSKNNTVIFKGGADEINVAFVNSHDQGKFALEVSTGNAATFNKAVDVTDLTLNQSATFNDSLDVSTLLSVTGVNTLTLNGAGDEKASSVAQLSANTASVILGAGVILNLGGGTEANPVSHSIKTLTGGTGSKLYLSANAVLNTITTANGVTLGGSGTYNLGAQAISNGKDTLGTISQGVSLGTDWTGTVKLGSGTTLADKGHDFNFNGFVNIQDNVSKSTVELEGVSGHLGSAMETAAAIRLTGEGLKINDTYNNTEYKFNGSISGLGKLTISKDLTSTFTFNGDTSGWTGSLVQTTGTYTYNFNGSTTIANNFESSVADGKFKVNVSNAQDVTLAGTLKANNASAIQVERKDSNGNLSVKSVELVQSGVVKIQGLQLSATSTSEATASVKAKADTDGALTYLAQEASFTIQDMTLTNTTITAATVDTKVDLSNVSVGADSLVTLAKGAFTVQDQANVAMDGSACNFTTSSYSGLALGAAGEASITLNLGDLSQLTPMGPGVYDIAILLDGFQMTGDNASVLFAADSWLGKLLAQCNNANVEISISQAAAGEAATAGAGAATGVSYSTGNVGTIITINGLNVPEPTTATLSLLALAGLCARRRRKM